LEGNLLLKHLIPQLSVNNVYEIVLADLWKNGIRGIITDLDNTLVGAKVPLATPELVKWLDYVHELGFKVVIVSNNNETRVGQFAKPLGVPYIHMARKPSNQAFRRALGMMNLKADEAAVIGDQLMTDVLGGNRMGLFTILVSPISLIDEGFFTRMNRRLEKIARRMMKR
jgi:HAD superfamily phosphatase (TIGR01668 family)